MRLRGSSRAVMSSPLPELGSARRAGLSSFLRKLKCYSRQNGTCHGKCNNACWLAGLTSKKGEPDCWRKTELQFLVQSVNVNFSKQGLSIRTRRPDILHCNASYSEKLCTADIEHATAHMNGFGAREECEWAGSFSTKPNFIFSKIVLPICTRYCTKRVHQHNFT